MALTALGSINAPSTRRRPRIAKLAALAVIALAATAVLPPRVSMAATAPGLGAAQSFAVLGAETVTNTGDTVVNGDLGVYPGLAVTGFDDPDGPGIVNGEIHLGDATALQAQSDALTAYNALSAQGCDDTLANQELGGRILTPGVYCLSTTAQLTGELTLDALGDPFAVFIFRIGTALTTASDSSVTFLNDFATCNVFWQAGSAATLGTDTDFVGTLITMTESITLNDGATVSGRLLALNAAVTLINNVITTTTCPLVSTPIDVTPVDDTTTTTTATTTDDTNDDTTDDTVGVPTTVGPAVPGLTTGGPAVPDSPSRPALPATGSNLVPATFAALAIMIGGALVQLTTTSRKTATASSRS
jgi:hypothetical protein